MGALHTALLFVLEIATSYCGFPEALLFHSVENNRRKSTQYLQTGRINH
jgi:hypothetical protein